MSTKNLKRKMNKKLLVSIVVLVFVSIASVLGIVTVLALSTRTIDSAMFIRFMAIDIDGEVEAQYRVGTGDWKPMGEKHVFNASDNEENAQMNPGNIALRSANSYVEFKYTFRNFGDADYTGLLTLDEVDQNDNMQIEYKYNDAEYSTSSYGLVVEGVDTAETTYTNAENKKYTEMTYYIKVGVKELSKSASYSSDFFWLLERYDGEVTGQVIPIAASEYVANGDGTYSAAYKGADISSVSTSAGSTVIENVWIVPNNLGSAAVTRVVAGDELPANTKVVLGDNITTIENVFTSSTGLSEIVLGNKVTTIPAYAFYNCTNLKAITIPNTVEVIGTAAYANCTNATTITIGENVTEIHDNAFSMCVNVTEVNYNAKNANVIISDLDNVTLLPFLCCGYVLDLENSTLESPVIISKVAQQNLNVGVNVQSLPMFGFALMGVTKINFAGNQVTTIPDACFAYCLFLEELTIPENIEEFGESVFEFCVNLKTIYWNANYGDMNNYIFGYSEEIENQVIIGENVTTLNLSIFRDIAFDLYIPANLTNIIHYGFEMGGTVKSITVASGNSKYYAEGNCLIEKEAKRLVVGCAASVIPNDVAIIGEYAFCGVNGIESVTLSNVKIERCAYSFCWDLQSVVIGDGITEITEVAFAECYNLTTVEIGKDVKFIGVNAFAYCSKLENVEFKNPNGWFLTTDENATSGTSFDVTNSNTQLIEFLKLFQAGGFEYKYLKRN